MEYWDILDEKGRKTGRRTIRGEPLMDGEYHLVVHIYMINSKMEFLIQKRSMEKELWPGRWDVTGGSVVCGEDSLTGAVREVQEELGIDLSAGDIQLITRLQRKDSFVDVWAAFMDISLDEIIMQKDEVDEVKFVSADELMSIILNAEYRDDVYAEVMRDFIETLKDTGSINEKKTN